MGGVKSTEDMEGLVVDGLVSTNLNERLLFITALLSAQEFQDKNTKLQ